MRWSVESHEYIGRMEPSPAELEKIYSQYTDAELVHIATRSAHHLRPEALAVIRGMLRARNVDEAVFQGIDAAVQPVDEVRVQEQVALIRSLPCPECGNRSAPLNAVLASRAISFLVMTSYDRTPYIGCLPCLERRCTKATWTSALAGWWGFPWGPVRTIQAVIQNHSQKGALRTGLPSETMVAFVVENTGKIEAYKGRPQELLTMITAPL